MCLPVCSVRLSYRFAHVYPTVSPRSRTRCATPRCRNCCEAASPAGPAPTTTTGTRSDIGSHGFRHAIRQRHDREVGIDLERIGEEARVRGAEAPQGIHAVPGVRYAV